MTYRLTILAGCPDCGRCSTVLVGWPEKYKAAGLLLSSRALDEHGDDIDKIISQCPLDLIELNEVPK